MRDRDGLEATRATLQRNAVRARAHARVADAMLDAAIAAFARDLVGAPETDGQLYRRFFPEPHEEIIAMGLESELPLVTLMLAQFAATPDLPATLTRHVDALRAGLRLGNAALGDRADALAELGRHAAREESWCETAASSLAAVRRALLATARARAFPPAWVDAFFRTA